VEQLAAALLAQRRAYRRLGFSTERVDLRLAELRQRSPRRTKPRLTEEMLALGQDILARIRGWSPFGPARVRRPGL
jgi:hypothetical protein